MTTSVNKGERRPRLRETGMSHDCQVKPDTQKEYFRVIILFPGGQISVCGGEKQTKHKKEPRCVLISFKVVTFLGLYNHMWSSYVISSKSVSSLSATLALVQK